MIGGFKIRYTDSARDDLLRLFDFLLERAETLEALEHTQSAIDAIKTGVEGHLSRSPFIFRKLGQSPFLRELIIPFGGSGYVALYEIEGSATVNVLAIRHQLEDDYH